MQKFKVLTLNTWQKIGPWEQRWKAILRDLEFYEADVVAFQELFDIEWRDRIARRARYPFVAAPVPSYSGLVLLSRLPIAASELHTFATRSPLENYGRYLLWAELAWHGAKIDVFNTHLSWMAEDSATRLAQVREISAQVAARQQPRPVLVTGDLNSTPQSEEVRYLLQSAKLADAFAALHPSEEGFTWSSENHFTRYQQPNLPDRRIDYILAGGAELVNGLSSCRVVFNTPDATGIFPSDHFGVMAEFAPRQN
jgi:endonuclease/exonuclease/phosphatase family metal-dependent hydrolase